MLKESDSRREEGKNGNEKNGLQGKGVSMNFRQAYCRTLREYEYNRGRTLLRSPPFVFQIELTNACPMKCIMCPRPMMTRPVGFMDEGCFREIVHQIKGVNHGVVLHHFGESLLHPKLYEFLSYLRKENISATISANPTELNQARIEALCQGGLSHLILCVDGVTDRTYKKIRGPHADLAVATQNIQNLIAYKRKTGTQYPRITVQMIQMAETEAQIDDFKKYWDIPGIERAFVKEFYLWSQSDEKMKSLTSPRRGGQTFPCNAPWDSVVILWDGRVVPCCNDFDAILVLGDLKNGSLEAIWNNSSMLELRRQHLANDLKQNPLCFECKVKGGNKLHRFYPLTLDIWFIRRLKERVLEKWQT